MYDLHVYCNVHGLFQKLGHNVEHKVITINTLNCDVIFWSGALHKRFDSTVMLFFGVDLLHERFPQL